MFVTVPGTKKTVVATLSVAKTIEFKIDESKKMEIEEDMDDNDDANMQEMVKCGNSHMVAKISRKFNALDPLI